MNAELPPFKNGEHNSEKATTIDRVITPLRMKFTNVCFPTVNLPNTRKYVLNSTD